jgi:hypothetical protein
MKKESNSGYITLYDVDKQFITSRKYKSILERGRILENWKNLYRLENKIYYLNIIPDIKTRQW